MKMGEPDQIDCTIEKGNPKPEIKWTKKGHNEEVLSDGPTLEFVNPTKEDQAVYCVEVWRLLLESSFEESSNLLQAKNVAGSDMKEIRVKIAGNFVALTSS